MIEGETILYLTFLATVRGPTIKCLVISTSNHILGRTIWDKLRKCIFLNFETVRVKRGQFHEGHLSQILPESNMSLLVN